MWDDIFLKTNVTSSFLTNIFSSSWYIATSWHVRWYFLKNEMWFHHFESRCFLHQYLRLHIQFTSVKKITKYFTSRHLTPDTHFSFVKYFTKYFCLLYCMTCAKTYFWNEKWLHYFVPMFFLHHDTEQHHDMWDDIFLKWQVTSITCTNIFSSSWYRAISWHVRWYFFEMKVSSSCCTKIVSSSRLEATHTFHICQIITKYSTSWHLTPDTHVVFVEFFTKYHTRRILPMLCFCERRGIYYWKKL